MSVSTGFQNAELLPVARKSGKPPRFNRRKRATKTVAYLAVYFRGLFLDHAVLRACKRAKWKLVASDCLVEKGDSHNSLHCAYFAKRMRKGETVYNWFNWCAQHSTKTEYNGNGYPVKHAISITGPYFAHRTGGIGKVLGASGSGEENIHRKRERAEMKLAIRQASQELFPVMLADAMDLLGSIRQAPDTEIVASEPYPPKSWEAIHVFKPRKVWEKTPIGDGHTCIEVENVKSGAEVWRKMVKRFPAFWAKTWNYLQSIRDNADLPDELRLLAEQKSAVLLAFAEKDIASNPAREAREHGADSLIRAGAINATGKQLDLLIRIGNSRRQSTPKRIEPIEPQAPFVYSDEWLIESIGLSIQDECISLRQAHRKVEAKLIQDELKLPEIAESLPFKQSEIPPVEPMDKTYRIPVVKRKRKRWKK